MDVLADLVATFERAGLSAPPIPASLVPQLRKLGDWFYATREISVGNMYMVASLVDEVVKEDLEDYVAVSHAGHGVNSYSINYALVSGSLGLFLQTLWGGVYMDADRFRGRCARDVRAGSRTHRSRPPVGRATRQVGRLLQRLQRTVVVGMEGSSDPSLDFNEQLDDDRSRSALTEALEWVAAQS